MIKFSLGGAAVVVSVALAAPAFAGPVVTFTTTGNTNTSGTAGNSKTYTSNESSTYHVRASAYSLVNGGLQTAYLGQYGSGLGVTSSLDGTGANNQHTTDNYGATNPNQSALDFIMLQFDAPVRLLSAVLTPFSLNGSTDNDSTTSWANTGQLWSNTLDFNDAAFVGQLNANFANKDGNGATGPIALNSAGAYANVWLVGASFFNTDGTDAFKLNTIKVDVQQNAVPEAATWAMMIAGFGLVGAAARRRPARLVQAI